MNKKGKIAVEFVKERTKKLKKYAKREDELVYNDIALNLINKLQKENEELKTDNYELNNRITDLSKNIPVQKIKDKIEELDKKVKDYQCVENRINFYQRKVLQELLEEEK